MKTDRVSDSMLLVTLLLLLLLPVALLTESGCDWINRVDPTIQPEPGQLCSNVEVECFDAAGKHAGCCPQGETCGGPHNEGCPAGECCDIGMGSRFRPSVDAGAP
jgi:hypothetical protein